jgi:TonB family protein
MTRLGLCVIAVLGLAQNVLACQTTPGVTLVDVPVPAYPPIAQSAATSGDVHVKVEVRGDGTVASATIANVEGFRHQLIADLLGRPALESARNAKFRCEDCGETIRSYSLLFSYRFAHRIGRAEGDVHPEVVSISPSLSRILIRG